MEPDPQLTLAAERICLAHLRAVLGSVLVLLWLAVTLGALVVVVPS